MKLYTYVVARDYGFAPNPFFGFCTVATCKPIIRRHASIGDWVLGTGSTTRNREGHVVFAMRVTETLSFDEYWEDPRFLVKRPHLAGSLKQAYGDNIYHLAEHGIQWLQENSHHSHDDGTVNPLNVARDTSAPRVLISSDFVYWGGEGPSLPPRFRNNAEQDVCAHRGHKCSFSEALVQQVVDWIREQDAHGYQGRPSAWRR